MLLSDSSQSNGINISLHVRLMSPLNDVVKYRLLITIYGNRADRGRIRMEYINTKYNRYE